MAGWLNEWFDSIRIYYLPISGKFNWGSSMPKYAYFALSDCKDAKSLESLHEMFKAKYPGCVIRPDYNDNGEDINFAIVVNGVSVETYVAISVID